MSEISRGERGSWRYMGHWDGERLMLGQTLAGLPVDERSAAKVIIEERAGHLHFIKDKGPWHIWDTRCLALDDSGQIAKIVIDYADRTRRLIGEARAAVHSEQVKSMPGAPAADIEKAYKLAWEPWKAAEKFHAGLMRSAGTHSLAAMLADLRGCNQAFLADRWPECLNCNSGVIDLNTSSVWPHDPRSMITYCIDADYVPGARAPGFGNLLWHVAGENPNVARYLVKMLGYSLLGDNREQLVFLLTGDTASGKSQLLEAVLGVVGRLGHASTGALVSRGKTDRHSRVENSLAGVRIVVIDESAERIRIDEGQLKRLTGAGLISLSPLYEKTETTTKVTWTIWIPTNELPTLTGFDDAIRRRLRAIPCGATIPPGQRIKKLGEKLAASEAEGILALLVWGAMTYLAEGEQCPPEVELATAEYESQQDTAANFRTERCLDVPAWQANGKPPATPRPQVWAEYVAWCQLTRTPMLAKQAFYKAFDRLPGVIYDKNQQRYVGLILDPGSRITQERDHGTS